VHYDSTIAVDNCSLEIPNKQYSLGLVGESGSGKSTLAKSIMNLIDQPGRIVSGKVEFNGANVLKMTKDQLRRYRWERVSMVYQSSMNSLNPVKTVVNHITEVLGEHTSLSKRASHEKAIDLLRRVGINSDRFNDYPHEFSGGMRQRVVIAMALALSPDLLIADEPTSALDVVVQREILSLLKKEISNHGMSLLFITHDIAILSQLTDEIAVMYRGEIVELGSIAKILFEPLHPYTEMLIGSLSTIDSSTQILESEESRNRSQIPARKEGCKYISYCKYAFKRCETEAPKLSEVEKNRWAACHRYNEKN
jgi:peptide/nickel transport system ATP-binding protein